MAERIENYINEITETQNNLDRMKINLLQSQINPHFLYNIQQLRYPGRIDFFIDMDGALEDVLIPRMLIQPGTKVYETALALGYTSLSHFNRIFHRYTGCTSKEYQLGLKKARE